jgi:hypothetical protein
MRYPTAVWQTNGKTDKGSEPSGTHLSFHCVLVTWRHLQSSHLRELVDEDSPVQLLGDAPSGEIRDVFNAVVKLLEREPIMTAQPVSVERQLHPPSYSAVRIARHRRGRWGKRHLV